jgi:hypothetical protein
VRPEAPPPPRLTVGGAGSSRALPSSTVQRARATARAIPPLAFSGDRLRRSRRAGRPIPPIGHRIAAVWSGPRPTSARISSSSRVARLAPRLRKSAQKRCFPSGRIVRRGHRVLRPALQSPTLRAWRPSNTRIPLTLFPGGNPHITVPCPWAHLDGQPCCASAAPVEGLQQLLEDARGRRALRVRAAQASDWRLRVRHAHGFSTVGHSSQILFRALRLEM